MGVYVSCNAIYENSFLSYLVQSKRCLKLTLKERVAHTKKRHVSESDSDSGPDDRNPSPAKKPTPAKTQQAAQKGGPPMDGGEPTWELGQNKKVKVREFKGKTYIDIREWYVDKKDMETKPGKKGVSLNTVQFQQLRSIIEEVNRALP